jgi:hypothetical protein
MKKQESGFRPWLSGLTPSSDAIGYYHFGIPCCEWGLEVDTYRTGGIRGGGVPSGLTGNGGQSIIFICRKGVDYQASSLEL